MNSDEPSDVPPGDLPNLELSGLQQTLSSSLKSIGAPEARFRLIHEFGRKPEPSLSEPVTLAVDRHDRLVVLDRSGDVDFRAIRFSTECTAGETLAVIPRSAAEGLLNPTGLALDGDSQMYIPDGETGTISKFSSDGRWLETISSAGADEGPFSNPCDVDLDAEGRLYVADSFNDRIVVLRPDGRCESIVSSFANPITGQTDDSLLEPRSICIGPDGTLFVADTNQHRVLAFRDGRVTDLWHGADLFEFPSEIRLSRDGRVLYVADHGNFRVQRFALGRAGSPAKESKTGELGLPKSRDADSVAGGGDIDVTSQGYVAMINPLRQTAVILDFLEN